ncbi:MAG: hypothetical protein JSV54_05475, partial [Chloroflexota bacterium]
MKSEQKAALKEIGIGAYSSMLSICQDGHSFSKTPVKGIDNSEILARINEYQPLTSMDGSFKSEVMKTVFNVGLKKLGGEPLWIVPNSMRYRRHGFIKKGSTDIAVLESKFPQNTLHCHFASLLEKDDRDILKFANKYGLLKRQPVHDLVFRNQDTGQQFQMGESLLWWREEIEDIAACLRLWDMVRADDEELTNVVLWHRDGITVRLDGSYVQLVGRANMHLLSRWRKGDTRGPALYYLSLEADKRLLNVLTPKMLTSQDCELSFIPATLLSMIWLMFLCEINGRTRS